MADLIEYRNWLGSGSHEWNAGWQGNMLERCANMKFGYDFGDKCPEDKGAVVDHWTTGDDECDAESTLYACGGVYHHNYMDVIGCRDHDCFWDCSECKRGRFDK